MALPGVGGLAKVAGTGGLISQVMNAGAGTVNNLSRGTAAMSTVPTGVIPAAAATESQPESQRASVHPFQPSTAGAGGGHINPLVAASQQQTSVSTPAATQMPQG